MLNKKIFLANLDNTSKNKINEEWIEYYESRLDSIERFWYNLFTEKGCPCCGSKDSALVGAHVGHIFGNDRAPYIVPICQSCNVSRKIVTVPEWLPLVPVPENSPNFSDITYPHNMNELLLSLLEN